MATHAVTDASFKADVLEADSPVLLDFWAEWCGPCKAITPIIEELATDYAGKATVGKLNVDNNPETAMKYGVRSCLLYTSPSPRDGLLSRMPSSA